VPAQETAAESLGQTQHGRIFRAAVWPVVFLDLPAALKESPMARRLADPIYIRPKPDVAEKLRKEAADRNETISDVIRRALRFYVVERGL